VSSGTTDGDRRAFGVVSGPVKSSPRSWLALVFAGCAPIHAKPVDAYPNIVVPEGPAGHLSGVDFEGLPAAVCAKQGMGSYCIDDFKGTMQRGIERLFGSYFQGDGPGFRAKFTFGKFIVRDKYRGCGQQLCTSSVPTLEWRFDLVRESDGKKPVRIALTTYSQQGYDMETFTVNKRDEAAASLIEEVLSAINARLSPAGAH